MTPERKIQWAKWLGWEYGDPDMDGHIMYPVFFKKEYGEKPAISVNDFNPDSPHCPNSVWREIYDMIHKDADLAPRYINAVGKILKLTSNQTKPWSFFEAWKFHTASPDVRCEALDPLIP